MENLYLRISITDRCNFRCFYCMPMDGVTLVDHAEILSFENLVRLTTIIHQQKPVRKIRITGGEPLVRKGAVDFVAMLSAAFPEAELCMTTNGSLLSQYAEDLKKAGLRRVNISLDTLSPHGFERLTRGGMLNYAISGIEAALNAGLTPIKINRVLLAEPAEEDIFAMVDFARDNGLDLRFLELMSIGEARRLIGSRFLPASRLLQILSTKYQTSEIGGEGTVRFFELDDGEAKVKIGIISPVSQPFCGKCDRLRIDARGRMFPCLLKDEYTDLGLLIRKNAPSETIADAVRAAIAAKKCEPSDSKIRNGSMHLIGG